MTFTVQLENQGEAPHDISFTLPARAVTLAPPLTKGQSGQLSVTAPTVEGSYEFCCLVGNHHELGMVGSLVVGHAGGTLHSHSH